VVTVDVLPNGLPGIRHFQGNSHDPEILKQVLEFLGDQPDVVFVDADHSDEAVRADFNLWWPNTGLTLGFHDILMASVAPFWNEISLQYPSVQIIGKDIASANEWQYPGPHLSGQVGCGGIGVLFK